MSGHVRRRGERSWELKYDTGRDHTGRHIRYVSFKGTKRDAEIELARLIAQNAAGGRIDPSKATIVQFIKRWDRDWASLHVSPKTLERYRQLLRLYVVPRLGSLGIQKLRPVHLQELYAFLLREGGQDERPLSASSVSYVHRVLHRMLGHAATWGIVPNNVGAAVSPPKKSETEISILNEEQIGAVLRHLDGQSLRLIVSFLLGTGARRGEALALCWKDIDLDKSVIRIERAVEQTKAGLRIKSPKTRHGRRNVSIAPSLVAELKAHRMRQQERRLALGLGRASGDDLVFARWDGLLRAPHGVSQKFTQAMKVLGINCSLHGLRHTHVSQLIAAGLDVLTISRRIGHASPAITLSVYGHMFKNTDTRAAEIMEAAFARVRTD